MRIKFYLKGSGPSPVEEFIQELSVELRGEAIYMLHAFKKKTQELPRKEIDLVLKRIKEI